VKDICLVVLRVSDYWAERTIAFFFVTLSNNFLGARRPAINYSRKLVQAYASVGMYQKKYQMLQTSPARMRTSHLLDFFHLLPKIQNHIVRISLRMRQ